MILTILYDVRYHFFPIWSKICQKSLCLTVLERLRLYEASLGSFVVINNIVLDIKLNADCDSDIIFWYKMIFFLDMVENMSKIAVFDRFRAFRVV